MKQGALTFLGIDVGTSSVKVLAFNREHRESVGVSYPPETSLYEHDADMVAQTVRLALRKLFAKGNVSPHQVAGIGLSGHGPSVLFINSSGDPLTPIMTWQDRRALKEAELLREIRPGFEKDATSMEAKLFWTYRHHPELFEPGVTALAPKAYVCLVLCGKSTIDLSTASTIDFYDRNTGKWDTGAAGFPLHVMPKVYKSWQEVGRTGTDFSRACGLPDSIPIFPGGIDAFCEAVGGGGFVEGVVVEGSGTSTCLTRSVAIYRSSSLHVVPGSSLQIETLSATGASYKWFGSCFYNLDLNKLSQQINPAKPVPVLFLPYLAGERSPIWDEKARGLFIGMDLETSAVDMLQALFQGVAFAIRQNLESMTEGENVQAVQAVGGSNRNDRWLQIKANVCGVPFDRMEEQDASAYGAAIVAAYGSGTYSMEQLAALTKVEKRFEPDLSVKAEYDKLFSSYVGLYPNVRETYWKLFREVDAKTNVDIL